MTHPPSMTRSLSLPALLTLAVLHAIPALAAPPATDTSRETGAGLKYQCEGYARMMGHAAREFDDFNGPRCYGYVQGVTEALDGRAFCLPALTLAQKVQTVQSYLSTHPARLQEDAVQLVVASLADIYPCPEP